MSYRELGCLSLSHEQAGQLSPRCSTEQRALTMAFQPCFQPQLTTHHYNVASPPFLSPIFFSFLHSFFLLSSFLSPPRTVQTLISSADLISAVEDLQLRILSGTQAPLLLPAEGGLRSSADPFHCPHTQPDCYRPSPPALPSPRLPSKAAPLLQPSPPHMGSELQQLNSDIRRKLVQPKALRLLPSMLAGRCSRPAAAPTTSLAPSLPIPSAAQFLPLASPQKGDLSLKTQSLPA